MRMENKEGNALARKGDAKKIRRADGTPARRTIFHISSRTPILRTDAKWDIDRPFIRRTEAAEGWHTQTRTPSSIRIARVVHTSKMKQYLCQKRKMDSILGFFLSKISQFSLVFLLNDSNKHPLFNSASHKDENQANIQSSAASSQPLTTLRPPTKLTKKIRS